MQTAKIFTNGRRQAVRLVTNDVKEFAHIPELVIENWAT